MIVRCGKRSRRRPAERASDTALPVTASAKPRSASGCRSRTLGQDRRVGRRLAFEHVQRSCRARLTHVRPRATVGPSPGARGSAGGVAAHGRRDLRRRPGGRPGRPRTSARALIGRTDRRGRLLWSLPKGHIEAGETSEQTAVREVEEETGIIGGVVAELGTIDYWFVAEGRRVHKTVHHYLMRAFGGELSDADVEVTEVAWVPLGELRARLAYADERRLIRRATKLLEERREEDRGPWSRSSSSPCSRVRARRSPGRPRRSARRRGPSRPPRSSSRPLRLRPVRR